MASWQSKRICNLLNKKIRKRPTRFEIIDEETVGLINIEKKSIKDISSQIICDTIQSQEKEHVNLIKRIDTALVDYSFRQHVILDKQGVVSIIIYQWPYRNLPSVKTTTELVIQRNKF